jgi:hypothetical protein
MTCDVAFVTPLNTSTVQVRTVVSATGELDVTANVSSLVETEPPGTLGDNTATSKLLPASSSSPAPNAAPRLLAAPALPATRRNRGVLRATPPRWSKPPSRVVYEWELCSRSGCTRLPGKSSLTVRVRRSYAGRSMQLNVTAVIEGQTVVATSNETQITR